MNNIREI